MMHSDATVPGDSSCIAGESCNLDGVGLQSVQGSGMTDAPTLPTSGKQNSATLPRVRESNETSSISPTYCAEVELNIVTAHNRYFPSQPSDDASVVVLPDALPSDQRMPCGSRHTSPTLNPSLQTTSPLIDHQVATRLVQRGPCESSGALLMSDEAVKEAPQSTQGGRSGKRGSRLPPRKPFVKKKKAVPAKGRSAQGARRGNGFTQNETESLLELLEEHLPLAKEEYEKISRLHELRYPQQKRNTDSIRRKISALCRTVPPTGDPTIPSDVLKAKEIPKAMTEPADIGEGDDSEDDYTKEMNDETIPVPAPGTPPTSGSAASIIPETTHGVTEEVFLAGTNPVAMHRAKPSPRPLVRKRSGTNITDDDSIMGVLKASILQENA